MPMGKGTYGSKVGRPPKKKVKTNLSPGRSPVRSPGNPGRPNPPTKAEKRSAAYNARRSTKSTAKRGSRTRRP